jgi:hypothetical protein
VGQVQQNERERADSRPQEQSDADQSSRRGGSHVRIHRRRRPLLLALPNGVLREIFVLPVHAIHRARSSAPDDHGSALWRSSRGTRPTGSENGEMSRSRSCACGWEAPHDRLGNRPAASRGTCLCDGRAMVIGVSLLSSPTNPRKLDRRLASARWGTTPSERQAAESTARGHVAPPCGTSRPTSRGRGRTPPTRPHTRAGLRAPISGRARADGRVG